MIFAANLRKCSCYFWWARKITEGFGVLRVRCDYHQEGWGILTYNKMKRDDRLGQVSAVSCDFFFLSHGCTCVSDFRWCLHFQFPHRKLIICCICCRCSALHRSMSGTALMELESYCESIGVCGSDVSYKSWRFTQDSPLQQVNLFKQTCVLYSLKYNNYTVTKITTSWRNVSFTPERKLNDIMCNLMQLALLALKVCIKEDSQLLPRQSSA